MIVLLADTDWVQVSSNIVTIVALIVGYLKLRHVEKVADSTHTLVNSNMGTQLEISAVALRRVANSTEGTQADSHAAAIAEKALAIHEEKQAKVDRGETIPLAPDVPKGKV